MRCTRQEPNDFRFADLCRFPGSRLCELLDAAIVDGAQGFPARRELCLLRRLESAFRTAYRRDHRLRLARRALDGSISRAIAPQADPCRIDRHKPERAGVFQVRTVLQQYRDRSPACFQHRFQAVVAGNSPADRHIVLYVRKPLVCHRRLSQKDRRVEEPSRL